MRGIAGIILLGGASRRFGQPKQFVRLGRRALLAHAIERLEPQAWPLALATGATADPPDETSARGLPCLDDAPFTAAGPLAGIRAGLAWLNTAPRMPDWLFSAPVDVPFLPIDLAAALKDAAIAADAGSAYAKTGKQHHAAVAIWHRRALAVIDELLAVGAAPVMAAHDRLGGIPLAHSDDMAFANINTPADLARAEEFLHKSV